jgi:aminocarboxymuconate-semialdehyde decarboxylase
MIIDSHAHLVPPSLLEDIRANATKFPSVDLIEADGGSLAFSFAGKNPTRPVKGLLRDIPARKAWLAERGIAKQVCGGWLDMFGNDLPAQEGEAWSRMTNEHLAQASKDHPELVTLATVPLQDGKRAAQVLRDAAAMGFKGTMIGTQPKGAGGVLDDPDLIPFWEAADDLGMSVAIHPVFESGDARVKDYGMSNAVGRVTDTLIAVSRLIYAGHVTRYKDAKIIAGIGGSALPYVVGRLRRNASLDSSLGDPDEALAALYYDSILQDARALQFLAQIVGTDRIMMGSDAPFPIGDPDPMQIVQDAGFDEAATASINGGLMARLLGMED